ncbi:hypothetical protein [Parendozoicomonas sp. Alg238-R29]|uniref:hypothetical protein n=1 Tax=Parendozoicomonas sp. Alg238-R29 TaxID=2993446 RepID=UPI00248E6E04|nr:hypothetical protein [Parendozoicomonas sp. Alg238-R29]
MPVMLVIPVSRELETRCQKYLYRVEEETRADSRRLLSVMTLAIEESLSIVVLDILEYAGLGRSIYAIASVAEKAVLKIAHAILKRVIRQMTFEHHLLVAEYMKGFIRLLDHPLKGRQTCLVIPMEHDHAVGMLAMIERTKSEAETLSQEEVSHHLGRLLDAWLTAVLEQPLAMLNLDSMASRIAEKSIHTARSTLRKASSVAYRHVSSDQKAKIGEYLGKFFVNDDTRIELGDQNILITETAAHSA